MSAPAADSTLAFDRLVQRGCLCGSERPADCPLHGPGDNRGIAAFFKAGMPNAFPMVAHCALCGTEGLMYPDVELDDPTINAGAPPRHRPTLICPRCSTPAAERALRAEVERSGRDQLNDRQVFA
jgi:hypothetical protein